LTFRSLSEAFIRRSWYSFLLDLDTMTSRHVKVNVRMAVLIAAAAHSQPFRTQQVRSYRSRYSREPCDQLAECNTDWQRAGPSHQVWNILMSLKTKVCP